ncbi:aldehyde dehydrogenase family protein [Streptomyces sp. NPDC051985]|uniref:aldehyde dehydrogenase family protein n=1 Tax=Streptomyces sp. NPDC051985 TaxID=3155807 RepID=UPI00341E7954
METPSWQTRLLIDGELVDGAGEPLAAQSPSTEEILAVVGTATPGQVGAATAAARRAFDTTNWPRDAQARRAAIDRLADLVDSHADELAASIVHDLGAPLSAARPLHVEWAASLLRWNARAAVRDRTIRMAPTLDPAPSTSVVRYVPAGVVAAITPYNYPLAMAASKLGAALAAGCTVVLTPSPQTMLSTLLLARLVVEAEIPAGVVNVVVGGPDVPRALTESPHVDRVTFTGSTGIGRSVMRQAASGLRGLVLELGGKAAAIVLPDAELDRVVEPIHLRYLRNSGQACQAPTRLLVHESKAEQFIAASRKVYDEVVVGDPWDERTFMGPVISAAHRARIESRVESALGEGATVVAGGGRPETGRGWYLNPTLLTGVGNDSRICQEEIFGPVAVVLPYRDIDEAVGIANDSDYGLAGAVWGTDRDRCFEVASRIRAGTVIVNGGGPVRPDAPISGWKQSGLGREFGEEGIHAFLDSQHIQTAS